MKKYLFLTIFSLFSVAYAQKKQTITSTPSQSVEYDLKKFQLSKQYSDVNGAITSLHDIILKEGAQSTYKDTLANLYFRSKNYVSCYLITKELLVNKPSDLMLLEMNAISTKSLGDFKAAVEVYENLFKLSQNQFHGYQLALLQFDLQRLSEAQASLAQALKCKDLEDVKLPFNINEKETQEVPLKAAVLNLSGIISYNQKDTKSAAVAFEQSLKIMPDFKMAQQNLATLEKENEKVVKETKKVVKESKK